MHNNNRTAKEPHSRCEPRAWHAHILLSGAVNGRCDAVSGGRSVSIVAGSRRWSSTCLTNTFSSIIIHILAQNASQSRVVSCSIKSEAAALTSAVSRIASRLLLDTWYSRSMWSIRDGADANGTILRIWAKIRYLLDTI